MTLTRTDAEAYRDHAPELVRYATVLIGPDDAADVVAEAVLNAFASPGWHTIENQRAYLYRTVLNQANAFRRSSDRRRQRERAATLSAARTASPATPTTSIDALRAVSGLSAQQRAIVFFTYWEDHSIPQIAETLDISEGSVRKQLFRARQQLKKALHHD